MILGRSHTFPKTSCLTVSGSALVIDAAPLVALADRDEPRRTEILDLLRAERGSLFIPAPVTSEIDYLLDQRLGPAASRAFLEGLAADRYESPALDSTEYGMALDLDRRYADLDLSLANLSVVVLAHRLGTRRILTFEQRHFRTVQPIQGRLHLVACRSVTAGCRDRWLDENRGSHESGRSLDLTQRVSGSVTRLERKHGPVWCARDWLASGREGQKPCSG